MWQTPGSDTSVSTLAVPENALQSGEGEGFSSPRQFLRVLAYS